jgi:hypothetical protein
MLKKGVKFKTLHQMRLAKFIIEDVIPDEKFPYYIRGYEISTKEGWIPMDYTNEVTWRWFATRKIEIINE